MYYICTLLSHVIYIIICFFIYLCNWLEHFCRRKCFYRSNIILLWNDLQQLIASYRSSHRRCSVKKGVLRKFAKFTGKHLCQSLFLNKVAGALKEALAQVFSCEFCEFSKNSFLTEHVWATASFFISIFYFMLKALFFLKI